MAWFRSRFGWDEGIRYCGRGGRDWQDVLCSNGVAGGRGGGLFGGAGHAWRQRAQLRSSSGSGWPSLEPTLVRRCSAISFVSPRLRVRHASPFRYGTLVVVRAVPPTRCFAVPCRAVLWDARSAGPRRLRCALRWLTSCTPCWERAGGSRPASSSRQRERRGRRRCGGALGVAGAERRGGRRVAVEGDGGEWQREGEEDEWEGEGDGWEGEGFGKEGGGEGEVDGQGWG